MTMTTRTTRRGAAAAVLLGLLGVWGAAAETPPNLRWRFAAGRVYTYAYEFEQRSSAHSKLDPAPVTPADEDSAAGGGRVIVAGGDGQGVVTLDHHVRAANALGRAVRPVELEKLKMTANVVLRPDGTVVTNANPASANLENFIGTMFPIPVAALVAGTPVRQPMKLVAPGVGNLEGEAVFTLQDEVRTNDLACLRYQVACTLRTPTPPPGADAPPQGEFTAKINCLFAPAEGCFLGTESDAVLGFTTRANVDMRLHVRRKVSLLAPNAAK
jgi:hypothetical protein